MCGAGLFYCRHRRSKAHHQHAYESVLLDSRPARKEGSGMDPLPHAPYPLAPHSQRACYLPWLKVSVALRYVRTFPWAAEAWREVRQHIRWLLAEEFRLRKAG